MLAWVYFIVYFTIGRFNVRVYDYRKEYRRMLIVSAFFVAGNAVNLTLFSNKTLSLYSLFYLAIFMLLGVIAMRSLQMGASMDKRWHAANVLTIVLFLLLAVAAAIAVYEIIVHGLPVLGLILIPFRRLFMWIYGLFGHNTEEAVAETPYIQEGALRLKQNFLISADELDADLLSKLEDFGFSRIQAQVFTIGAYLLLAAVVVAAIWLIIRLAMRGKVEAAEEKEYEDVESFTGDRRKKKARREKAQGRAQTVRKLYHEYLDYLSEKGLRRTTADTSKDVLEGSERISEETTPEEEAFRRIYLKARYGADNVTEEDVAEARRILDSVRGGK
jgi:hypothetical protein